MSLVRDSCFNALALELARRAVKVLIQTGIAVGFSKQSRLQGSKPAATRWDINNREPRQSAIVRGIAKRMPARQYRHRISFSFAGRLLRVHSPVVQSPAGMMNDRRHDMLLCSAVLGSLSVTIARGTYRTLEPFSKEPLRGFRIAALVHQNVEPFTALIDRAP
jgi:hypothetical protein